MSPDPGVSSRVRPPSCAGSFYPHDPGELRATVQRYLAEARGSRGQAAKAIIAPHAGYIYSGPIAGSAYACWQGATAGIRRVIVIGPAHYEAFRGLASSSAEAFETPLGRVPLDPAALETLRSLGQVRARDSAHEPEHCLEVQLPFLQVLLDDFHIVPLLVGEATDTEVAGVLEALWDGAETRIVVSSDLSHYLSYAAAKVADANTASAIHDLLQEDLGEETACGVRAIRGLLRCAQAHRLQAAILDLRNSGDTAGPRDRVVGYGAFAFTRGAA